MKKKFCKYISSVATRSMLYELSASPKPGLVDRNNSGAHDDMDFFTFLDSISVLGPYFELCALAGLNFKEGNYRGLLKKLRPLGIEAEKDMFKATSGVNTHKGVVFSQGIIASAAGILYSGSREVNIFNIIETVKEITWGVTDELEIKKENGTLTYGERLFKKYGITGIRGEVEAGFPTVWEHSYPFLKELIAREGYKKTGINDIMVQTLLKLMAHTEDSNILGRAGKEGLEFVQSSAKEALDLGGIFTSEGKRYIKELDNTFIRRNISPGGSADLLSVTFMLFLLENGGLDGK